MNEPSTTHKKKEKCIRRGIEASVGTSILKVATKLGQKAGKLVGPKSIFLPKSRVQFHYYEREAQGYESQQPQPTLIFCHGIAERPVNFGPFIASLDIPPHVRILCPEQLAHGEDLKRYLDDPSQELPTHRLLLETTSEFLDVVKAGPNCNVFGISMGGALAYFLRWKRPDVIKKSVLVSPAIGLCLDEKFVGSIVDGKNTFVDFQSRDDVKVLFRDYLSTGPYDNANNSRQKKYGIPPFFFEAIFRQQQIQSPPKHFTNMMLAFFEAAGVDRETEEIDSEMGSMSDTDDIEAAIKSKTDVDSKSPRLIFWPEDDQICNYEKGRKYFEPSMVSSTKEFATTGTQFETIPNCGHVFDVNGKGIYQCMDVQKTRSYLLDFSF